VKLKAIIKGNFLKSAWGAVLTVLCGLILWKTPVGEPWVNASYDYLFRFGHRSVTNSIVLIRMDDDAYGEFHQEREHPWDRALHAKLLNKLADDGAALVVFDSFFGIERDPGKDTALAAAMRRQQCLVLLAKQAQVTAEQAPATRPIFTGAHPTLPCEPFLSAAGPTNWGVGWLDPDLGGIVRKHWPFTPPWPDYPSLPQTVAALAGAHPVGEPREQWLRYYGEGSWTKLSYGVALAQATNYFHGRIVFIGSRPSTSVPNNEMAEGDRVDEFQTPYTRWTGESAGGVEIMITAFLNLMNGDSLERPVWWVELLAVIIVGVLLGGILPRLRPVAAISSAAVTAMGIGIAAVSGSYYTAIWFPWLVIAAGQVPCALTWAILMPTLRRVQETVTEPGKPLPGRRAEAPVKVAPIQEPPDTPDYELYHPPFGEGAYGKVWVCRNAIGQWQALKVVYLANFDNNRDPFEREFNGISRYKPISDKHPGLLRVDFVSKKRPGYFYYVMELGDPLDPGWEKEPSTYKPRDLVSERARARGRKLPVHECVRIGLVLTDALDFLHRQGLIHRDIKPQNIIFVNGTPKLADVGLTAQIRPLDEERTFVGTPGYMPPPPEAPGTIQADLYALGMVLYVLSTGRNAAFFPEVSTTLVASPNPADFFPLNTVILKACHPDIKQRYASATEMHKGLLEAQKAVDAEKSREVSGSTS
jgi:CHASE2 domain-containing sensor protein